ncbi:uncharacterized protein LOC110608268 isoform X3 [Manihot esculenta]|uniref:uncharacterized protein LOC110608268 isoform X3 n=1 Tax=Manihot esculenta TaxID=3983 RepID=UPI001CC70F9B|nr:uncharacterized protein LOC110608268 isoform X3 [Manihot esculenta]
MQPIVNTNNIQDNNIREINLQNNWTNVSLHIIGQQLDRMEEKIERNHEAITNIEHIETPQAPSPTTPRPNTIYLSQRYSNPKPYDIDPAIKPINKPFTKMIPPSQNPIEIVTLSPKTELTDMSKLLQKIIKEQNISKGGIKQSTSPKTNMTGGIKINEPIQTQSNIPSESTSKDKNKITILTEYNETSSSEDDTINNPLEASDSDQENNIPVNTIGRNYDRRPDDLKILDRKQKQYNAKNIYEWNIDDMSEIEIIQITKEMVIVGNIYKQRVGVTEREAAENIILGFTGELRTWWDKLLSNEIKTNILTARRIDNHRRTSY